MKRHFRFACCAALLMFLTMTFAVPSVSHATTDTPTPSPTDEAPAVKPLFVLMEFNPWKMVIGSDSPSVVLYDNGQVIFLGQNEDGKPAYFSADLDQKAFDELRDQLTASKEFFTLEPYYDLVLKTDQPSNTITVWDEDGKAKRVGVYGDLRDDKEARDQTPGAFLDLFDAAVAYKNEDATAWLPEKIEVMVWEYDTSDPTKWPANWPDLNDPTTVKRDQVYSIYLDSAELPTFLKLAENASAFLINGKTWSFSIRYSFPNEQLWQEGKTDS